MKEQEYVNPDGSTVRVIVGEGVTIGEGVTLADRAVIGAGAVVGAAAMIGAGVEVGPAAEVGAGAVIGEGAVVGAAAVIGMDASAAASSSPAGVSALPEGARCMRPSDRGASHTEVAVRLTNGGWTKVTNAEVLGDGLLAVHPAFVGDLAKVFTGPAWTLSHLPTGCAVLRCDRREDCVKIGNELLERLTGDDLKRWKRRSPAAIAKTSASIIDWLRRCKKARKYVAFKRRSRR